MSGQPATGNPVEQSIDLQEVRNCVAALVLFRYGPTSRDTNSRKAREDDFLGRVHILFFFHACTVFCCRPRETVDACAVAAHFTALVPQAKNDNILWIVEETNNNNLQDIIVQVREFGHQIG